MSHSFFNNLNTLPLMNNGKSRAINAENRQGKKGAGGMAASELGQSRKGSPAIKIFKKGTIETLAEIEGPGVIEHIWITVTDKTSEADCFVLRDVVLRMYWDDEDIPSVEAPLGDFFCLGFGASYQVNSMAMIVNPLRGMNCYIPMPFHKKARITVENQHASDIPMFFYQIDYCLYDEIPENSAYFHARWRREPITSPQQDYVIIDNIKGKGHYIGTFMCLSTLQRYWWGEGEVKFYIDGDDKFPTICGTGTEDYFGGAWCYAHFDANGVMHETTYNSAYLGYPYFSTIDDTTKYMYHDNTLPPMRSFYRWHIMDPIRFTEDLRVTVQQIGISRNGLFERQDDVSTVAYWYQTEPHVPFPLFMPVKERWPR